MLSTTYDYTRYVLRTDPTCPVPPSEAVEATAAAPDLAAALSGTFAGTMPVIASIWAQVSPDPVALVAMVQVVLDFTETAEQRGFTRWADVPTVVIGDFVHEAHGLVSDDARRLRKNAVHGCYLALVDAGLHDGLSPAEGIDPVAGEVRDDERGKRLGDPKEKKTRRAYRDRVHVRSATHEEVLLARLASRLTATGRTIHLCAAAIAVCSASGATSEAPQVLWDDLGEEHVALIGRAAAPGREETAIEARTVPLDAWGAQAIADWRRENEAVRPVAGNASALYGGRQLLTSNSAGICVDQQVRKALEIADLRREPGLTAGSLRLWAAARLVTDFPSLAMGAQVAGIDPLTLHRQITQQGDRGLRLNH